MLSKHDINLIRNLRNRGFGITPISEHLSIPKTTVSNVVYNFTFQSVPFYYIDTANINLSSGRGNLSSDLVSFIRFYGNKICYKKLSEKYNISKSVFYSIIRNELYASIKPCNFDINIEDFKKENRENKVTLRGIYQKRDSVIDVASGVYIIQNIINGKCYVGSSYNIRKRLFWHSNMLENNNHPNKKLQNSYNKHSKINFIFIPLLNCPKEYNHILEQWVMDKSDYNCWYNIAKDCLKPNRGLKLTQEQKDKISDCNKGKKWNDKQKQNLKNRLLDIKQQDLESFKNKRLNNFKNKGVNEGSQNGNSKLSEDERLDIIYLINKGERNRDIILKYPNITSGLITEVKGGRTWQQLQKYIIR